MGPTEQFWVSVSLTWPDHQKILDWLSNWPMLAPNQYSVTVCHTQPLQRILNWLSGQPMLTLSKYPVTFCQLAVRQTKGYIEPILRSCPSDLTGPPYNIPLAVRLTNCYTWILGNCPPDRAKPCDNMELDIRLTSAYTKWIFGQCPSSLNKPWDNME